MFCLFLHDLQILGTSCLQVHSMQHVISPKNGSQISVKQSIWDVVMWGEFLKSGEPKEMGFDTKMV